MDHQVVNFISPQKYKNISNIRLVSFFLKKGRRQLWQRPSHTHPQSGPPTPLFKSQITSHKSQITSLKSHPYNKIHQELWQKNEFLKERLCCGYDLSVFHWTDGHSKQTPAVIGSVVEIRTGHEEICPDSVNRRSGPVITTVVNRIGDGVGRPETAGRQENSPCAFHSGPIGKRIGAARAVIQNVCPVGTGNEGKPGRHRPIVGQNHKPADGVNHGETALGGSVRTTGGEVVPLVFGHRPPSVGRISTIDDGVVPSPSSIATRTKYSLATEAVTLLRQPAGANDNPPLQRSPLHIASLNPATKRLLFTRYLHRPHDWRDQDMR